MAKTFKVISQVIRLRRHGGVYKGRNNVDYPIRNAEQYEQLVKLEDTADVMINCTSEERSEYEAQLAKAEKPKEVPTAPVKAQPVVPQEPTKAPQAPEPKADGAQGGEGEADDLGDEDESDV